MAKKKAAKKAARKAAPARREDTLRKAFAQAKADLPAGVELQKLLRRDGVTGVSVGMRHKNSQRTDEVVIRIHVARKKDKTDLTANQMLPCRFGKTSVDIIESGGYESCQAKAASNSAPPPQYPPIDTGSMIGPAAKASDWGTLGLVVKTQGNSSLRLLTNAHVVLAGRPISQVIANGEQAVQPPKGKILPDPQQRILGSLIKSSLTLSGEVDAATFDVDPNLAPGVGNNNGVGSGALDDIDAALKSPVKMKGAASPSRKGTVFDIHFITKVSAGVTLREQILIEPDGNEFSAPGDSGSALIKIDTPDVVVGLVHGRTEVEVPVNGVLKKKWFGVASPIQSVFGTLKVQL